VNVRIGIVVVAVAVLAGSLQAQKPGTVGIGVSITPFLRIAGDAAFPQFTSFTVPMNFGAFRLEPEIGFGRSGSRETDTEESSSNFALGTGAYYLFGVTDGFLAYVGPRIGFLRESRSFKFTGSPEETEKRTDTFFGLALGGEHLFSSHVSLGAEARFTHIRMGETKIEGSPGPGADPDIEASATFTDGLVFVRFYF